MTVNNQVVLNDLIHMAIEALKNRDVELATTFLHEAMTYDDKLACIHNLFGIMAEINGNTDLACTYYRAASVFDPQYEPANRNLERITNFEYHFILSKVCFDESYTRKGKNSDSNNESNRKSNHESNDATESDSDSCDYYISYDHLGVGHIKKRA